MEISTITTFARILFQLSKTLDEYVIMSFCKFSICFEFKHIYTFLHVLSILKPNYCRSSDDGIVIFCLANGEISFERFDYRETIQFTNIYTLEMANDLELKSSHMILSSDKIDLIVYNNSSGSILRYKLNLRRKSAEISCPYERCTVEHQVIDENAIADCLSLEQQKHLEMENNRKIEVQNRKAEILEIIAKLKNEFAAIKIQNAKLPSRFQLDATAFEIDRRITDDLEWRTRQKFRTIQEELLKKIDKIRTQADRMQHIHLDTLEHWPIKITGFRLVILQCIYLSACANPIKFILIQLL